MPITSTHDRRGFRIRFVLQGAWWRLLVAVMTIGELTLGQIRVIGKRLRNQFRHPMW